MDWYFFINVFTRCRSYFTTMCSMLVFFFCAPLALRFYKYPYEMIAMMQLLRFLFNPSPTLQDVSFAFALVVAASRTVARMRISSVIAVIALPVPIILYVIDFWLWLQSGSGNANYMFFQCLAFNLFLGIFTLDFISATLKRDKALCLTEKGL
jgi:phosphatidylinositol glycan class U